jgi:hypothetical protein
MSELNERYEKPTAHELESRRQGELVEASRLCRLVLNGLTIETENFQKATEEDEFLAFKFLHTNGITSNGLSAVDWYKSLGKFNKQMEGFLNEQFGRCTRCKESVAIGDVCCGNEPVRDNE